MGQCIYMVDMEPKAMHGGILHYLGMPAVDWGAQESQL